MNSFSFGRCVILNTTNGDLWCNVFEPQDIVSLAAGDANGVSQSVQYNGAAFYWIEDGSAFLDVCTFFFSAPNVLSMSIHSLKDPKNTLRKIVLEQREEPTKNQ
jgi:hypothetical protein